MAAKIVIETAEVKISNQSYVSFVVYQIALPAGGSIQRRYSEFVWLKESLNRDVPGAIVPPLPPDTGGKGNVDPSFIKERKAGLAAFLNAVQAHEELSDVGCFRCELNMDMLVVSYTRSLTSFFNFGFQQNFSDRTRPGYRDL